MNIRYKFRGAPTSRKDTFFEGRKILVHPIISYIYSNYGFNPNPRRLHKRDTSASILYRLPSTVSRYPDFKTTFYESMRMSFLQIKKVLESVDIRLRTNCGKVLTNSLYFRCLDCEVQSEAAMATVYCPDCFSHSRHEGHRVISKISGDNPANCDCGDPTIIKEEGFCPNHGLANEEEIREAIRGFPDTLKDNFFAVMANVFYALFTLCEEFLKRPAEERKEDSSFSLDQLMEDIIAVVKELYKINPYFKLVISRFLMKTPEEFPQSNMLCHNCHNLSRNEIIGSRRVCGCTYLTNILRYHSLFSRELNTYLMSFLADLLIDTRFKLFFSDCFTRYIHYLFPMDETGTHECYGLEGLVTQAYTGENNCRVILENNMNIVISIIEEVIERIPHRYEDLKNQHITTLYGLMNFIHYLPEKKWAGRALYEGTNVIERLIQAVCSLQGKHVQYIIEYSPPFVLDGWNYNVGAFSRELELDAHIFRTLNMVFTSACVKSYGMKESILQAYNICMQQFLKEKDELKSERKKSIDYTGDTSITLHQMTQRLFIILLAQNLSVNNKSISLKNIDLFVENVLSHPEKSISNIALTFIKEDLKCLGALSYLTLATTVDNFSVSYHYFLPSSPFYYYDMLSLQIFANYIPIHKLFKTFWKYFFVLDESTITVFQYFFDTNWDNVDINDVRRIRSFLEFLAHFLSTELPLLNSFSSIAKVKADQFSKSLNSIHGKSLALLLQKFSNQYIDIQTVKTCADLVLSDQLNHTERLQDVCEIEKKTGKIKLKSDYKQMRQSYYFPDSRVENDVAQSFMENFPEKDSIDSYEFKLDFDVVTGLREKFFEGDLAVWLVRFFMEFKEDWIDFLPHVMKLTLIGLEVLKGRTCGNKKCEGNLKTMFVQNLDLVKRLEEIEKQLVEKGTGSLTMTFKRIREVIGQCSDAEKEMKLKEESEKSKEDDEAERKRKMRQRQLEIQKQFQMKQANFVQHMKPETQKVFVEEKKKDEEANKESQQSHVCHFCRERIDLDGNDYGVPIYVGKCNINFSEKEVKSQDSLLESVYDNTGPQFYHFHEFGKSSREKGVRSRSCFSPAKKLGTGRNDIMKIKHYPFITSCMHMAHIKCHENYIRDIDDEEAYFFCAYCKSTYNCLLTKSTTKTTKDTRKATVKLSDTQRVPLPFTRTFLKAAGVAPSPSGSISLSQLSYLIHLLLAGFLQVTKNKSLYDLESFMAKRYLPYKLLFENMTRFMKEYSKCFKVDLGDTIFSLFYKTIYEMDSKCDTSFGDGCMMNTPPNKTPRSSRTGIIVPNGGANVINRKGKANVYPKSEISLEGSSYRSPIKTFIYQDKGLNSNYILHQLQNSRTKPIYNRLTKLGSAIYRVNKKTIPEKKEVQIEKEMSPISFSLQSLEPSESEINSIKQQLSCLLKEELEEALQKETIKAMKSKASDVEIKRILGYGVFLGTLQVLMKVLCAFDEDIEIGSYQEIMDQVMSSELLYINFKDELVIFLERMLTISFMTFNIKEAYTLTARIQEIMSSSNNEEKYIDALLNVFDPEIDLKCLLSEKIINKLRIEDGFIIAWQRILSETLASDVAKEKAQSLNTLSHPQLVVDMPDNYLEFNNEYVCKKCDLCRNLSANNHSAICLQCGATFCLSPCSVKNPWGDNLCDHANTQHKGECVGLCIQTCEIILVCSKFKTFLKESLYMDKFGQSPAEIDLEGPNVEWSEVKLKKDLMGQLTGWISNHKIVQQIGFEIQKYHMA